MTTSDRSTISVRGESAGPDDTRTIVGLLVDQVEFANVVVINKCDLATAEQLERIEGVIRGVNPGARVIRAERGPVPLGAIVNTGMFELDKAQESSGWMTVMRGEELSEADEYGITSVALSAAARFRQRTAG